MDLLAKHNNPHDPVYIFCTKNNIEISWDRHAISREIWNEIFHKGELLLQVDQLISVEQFKAVVRALHVDFKTEIFPDIDGKDFTIACRSKELFEDFYETHKELFNA